FSSPGRRVIAVAAAAALAALGALAVPAPARAAAAPPGSCPAAVPVSQFTARVIGVLRDGIAPGLDMIIVETDSPAIRAAGGIWAGMSGSPVYTSDGRLLGAVAFGLSGAPSRIGGITPAEEMLKVLGFSSAASPQLPARVRLPKSL